MEGFTLEVWDEGPICILYTVRKEGSQMNETDRFFERIRQIPMLLPARLELSQFLTHISDISGALQQFFNREENTVYAIPPKKQRSKQDEVFVFEHLDLRLFTIRLSSQAVVLFNGGEKTAQTVQNSPSLRMPFNEANKFAKAIYTAMADETFVLKGSSLISELPLQETVLYC